MWKLSLKEVFSQRTLSFLFVLNLSCGMAGFLALELFKSAVSSKVAGQSEKILQGQFEVSSRFALPDKLKEELDGLTQKYQLEFSEELSLFSMINASEGERLVQLFVVQENYPLVGDFLLDEDLIIKKGQAFSSLKEGEVWVYPEIEDQLSVKVGDSLFSGSIGMKISHVVNDDPSLALGGGASFAPRVFMRKKTFEKLDLMKKGTTFRLSRKFVGVGDNKEVVAEEFRKAIEPYNEVKFRLSEQASAQNMRLIDYLGDYLGLISLLAFFLSLIGSLFLFYLYLEKQKVDTSILYCLGMEPRSLLVTKYYSLSILFLMSLPLIGLMTGLFYLAIRSLLQDSFQFEVASSFDGLRYILILVVLFMVSSIALFPVIRRMCQRSVKEVFNDGDGSQFSLTLLEVVMGGVLLVLLYGLAVYLSQSLKIAAFFVIGLIASLLFFWIVGLILLRVLAKVAQGLWWPMRVVLIEMKSHSIQSNLLFVTLGFSMLILNLIPHIRESLVNELKNPEGTRVPAFFLFDIQEEQLNPIETILKDEGARFRKVSPMIRARLIEVNGEDFEKDTGDEQFQTREGENEARFRNRGFNLSYEFIGSGQDRILEGRAIQGEYDWNSAKPVEVSVETRFADRLGFNLGDKLLFDIQGVELLTEIVNLRQVKWTEFDPNFFVELQKGALDQAPKIFLASVLASQGSISKIQRKLSQTVQNVSIIEVGRLIDKILELTDKIVGAILLMAYLALFVGALVLYSILMTQAMRKIWQYHLFQTLGSHHRNILFLFSFESLILGLVGGALGYLGALGISYVVMTQLFQFPWVVDSQSGLLLFGFLVFLCGVLAMLVAQYVLRSNTNQILAGS